MAARMGETWGTNPLTLLDVDQTNWFLLMACVRVLNNDADERERQRNAPQDVVVHDPGFG